MNPYDHCVFNGMSNEKYLTAAFYVDNLKLSHMEPFKITFLMCYLYRIYENKLVVHLGKVHDCIGINFDLSEKGKLKIDIFTLL